MELRGTVIGIDKKICVIYSDKKKYRAIYTRRRIEGAYTKQAKPVTVGDEVEFEVGQNRLGWLKRVLPRKTWLARNAVGKAKEQVVVANVEQICIVCSIFGPPFRSGIIDRMLVGAHKGDLEPIIVLNKVDLRAQEKNWDKIAGQMSIYEGIGYPVIYTSVIDGQGISVLKERLEGRSSVFTGHSGVGKSALLGAVEPDLELKTRQIGRKSRRGQHTTTRVTLLPLKTGGFVVDTPGIREFSLWQLNPGDLDHYFPEIEDYAARCKYKTCIHVPEPYCAVKEAVEEGKISLFRYENYCRILESIEEEKRL